MKVDGLKYESQWWGGGSRRRRSADPLADLRLKTNPAEQRRFDAARRERVANVTYWPPEPPIELLSEHERNRRDIVHQRYRWPNGIVPYVIESSLSAGAQSNIAAAMAEYSSLTCLRFVPRSNEAYYMRFRSGSKCEALANGRSVRDGGVVIELASACQSEDILHKIGHVIGMFHESNRRDRDSYVVVHPENSDEPIYFERLDHRSGDVFRSAETYGSYDFDSIMHPRKDDDLKPSLRGTGAKTMTLTALGATLADPDNFGRGSSLSSGDEAKIEAMYGSMCVLDKCEYTVVEGDTLAQIVTNLNNLFSLTPALTVTDVQRMNSQKYPALGSSTNVQVGWVIRYCYEENLRGFVVSVPQTPPSGAQYDMVDTKIFRVHLKTQPTSSVTLVISSSNASVAYYDQARQGAITFTTENWHVDREVLLADPAPGTTVITIRGTGGDYNTEPMPEETLSYIKNPPGVCARRENTNDPNECECAAGLRSKCRNGFCSVSGQHCSYLDKPDESNMQSGSNQTCTPPAGTPDSCSSWAATLTWLPSGYRQNLEAFCTVSTMTDTYTPDKLALMQCIVNNVQDNMAAISSGYRSAVQTRVAAAPTYDDAAMDRMYRDLLTGWSGNPSLADTLFPIFKNAYKNCCCAVSPGTFLAWLAANPGAVNSQVVVFNTILFGVCEDRRLMDDAPDNVRYWVKWEKEEMVCERGKERKGERGKGKGNA